MRKMSISTYSTILSVWITQCFLVFCSCNINAQALSLQLVETSTPPLLDVPTYSLATQGTLSLSDDNEQKSTSTTAMNILTYATPVSIRPDRIWSIGLYKGTTTHENFVTQKEGVLQLLKPEHAPIVKLLGGSSSREVDKAEGCKRLGFRWISKEMNVIVGNLGGVGKDNTMPCDLLPNCACYLKLSLVGELIDCGSHDVALCKVESISVATEGSQIDGLEPDREYLNTALLREMKIITDQGRVAE